MFAIMTPENSATVATTNNLTGHTEEVITGRDAKSIWYAVFCFAKRQGISMHHVGYAVRCEGTAP